MISVETNHLITFQHGAKMWHLKMPFTHSNRLGQSRSKQKGRGIEFHNARIYQAGDDVRSIDWRITARKAKAHTREFQEDREHQIMLVVDMDVFMKFGSKNKLKSVLAAEIAALLGWIALAQQDRIGGWIHGSERSVHKPARRRSSFSAWLGHLSHASKQLITQENIKPHTWDGTLEKVFYLLKESSMTLLIGDMLNLSTHNINTLIGQSKKHDIVLIHVYDPLEKDLPKAGYANFSNGENCLQTDLSKIHETVLLTYEKALAQLKEQCLTSNISFLNVSTEDNLILSLQQQGLIHKA